MLSPTIPTLSQTTLTRTRLHGEYGRHEPAITSRRATLERVGTDNLSALSHFELADQLVQIWIRNDRHLSKLDELKDQIEAARRYLSSAKSHRILGEAYLGRLQEKRSQCLLHVCSDRRLAVALVRESEARRQRSRDGLDRRLAAGA